VSAPLGAATSWSRDEVDRWISYHGGISFALSKERQSLESALIPVTAYILIAALECYRRHPAMMREIAASMAPEEIGAAGRTPGNQIDGVHLWSIANIGQYGRKVLATAGLLDPDDDLERNVVVLDFWKRAAGAFRGDGHLQSWDAGMVVTPYVALVDEILAASRPIDGDAGRRMRSVNALLTSYLFLLYFDTRAGYQDTGPYLLPDGRVLLLRAFSKFGISDFPWSTDVGAGLAFSDVLLAFVLDGVDVRVTDFGTSLTEPEDYLGRVSAFAGFSTSGGRLDPLAPAALDELIVAVRAAQKRLYRLIAGLTRREKINAGAYVYFSFLRPFAEVAGVADRLDWTVPRDSLDLYPLLEQIDSGGEIADDGTPWYPPLPARPS
jgi:hypothetical protein